MVLVDPQVSHPFPRTVEHQCRERQKGQPGGASPVHTPIKPRTLHSLGVEGIRCQERPDPRPIIITLKYEY